MLSVFQPFSVSAPIPCLQNTTATFDELIACFYAYTVPQQYYIEDTYAAAQPSSDQLSAWEALVSSLLSVDGNCTSVVVPEAIADIYGVSLFTDSTSGLQYCIASELNAIDGVYANGWGLVAVPATCDAVELTVHLAAPHPIFDGPTALQAAALFSATGARSLLISGRHREAYDAQSDCVIPTSAKTVYYKTDPTHDVNEPFHSASTMIIEWQRANGGCPSESCAIIQLHGKAETSCPTDAMFMSSGIGSSASSVAWYTDSTDRPIKRLKNALITFFAPWNVSLPSDSSCSLTATDNVFGRLVNGIDASQVCTHAALANTTTGEFVHIEQVWQSISPDAYGGWAEALVEAFGGGGM
ncbi:hypothetical protein FB45DRAFT_759820 [Roridomyces roridus]|uniref:Uncharacterized protein n=1 Tax=Roridomyces roridus TaxID=1738132 RepID=A0AAD7B7L2_9AGAR|nr:hypothetical protein FB45DRAFT_759820 [Roridomyces roridus]